jgi:hypothetical protein
MTQPGVGSLLGVNLISLILSRLRVALSQQPDRAVEAADPHEWLIPISSRGSNESSPIISRLKGKVGRVSVRGAG